MLSPVKTVDAVCLPETSIAVIVLLDSVELIVNRVSIPTTAQIVLL